MSHKRGFGEVKEGSEDSGDSGPKRLAVKPSSLTVYAQDLLECLKRGALWFAVLDFLDPKEDRVQLAFLLLYRLMEDIDRSGTYSRAWLRFVEADVLARARLAAPGLGRLPTSQRDELVEKIGATLKEKGCVRPRREHFHYSSKLGDFHARVIMSMLCQTRKKVPKREIEEFLGEHDKPCWSYPSLVRYLMTVSGRLFRQGFDCALDNPCFDTLKEAVRYARESGNGRYWELSSFRLLVCRLGEDIKRRAPWRRDPDLHSMQGLLSDMVSQPKDGKHYVSVMPAGLIVCASFYCPSLDAVDLLFRQIPFWRKNQEGTPAIVEALETMLSKVLVEQYSTSSRARSMRFRERNEALIINFAIRARKPETVKIVASSLDPRHFAVFYMATMMFPELGNGVTYDTLRSEFPRRVGAVQRMARRGADAPTVGGWIDWLDDDHLYELDKRIWQLRKDTWAAIKEQPLV